MSTPIMAEALILRMKGLRVAHTPEPELGDATIEVDGPEAEAVVIVGTNPPMARVAVSAEFWLSKPVIALNTAIYTKSR